MRRSGGGAGHARSRRVIASVMARRLCRCAGADPASIMERRDASCPFPVGSCARVLPHFPQRRSRMQRRSPTRPWRSRCRNRSPIPPSTPCASSSPRWPSARIGRRWQSWSSPSDFSGTARTVTAPTNANPPSIISRPRSASTTRRATAGTYWRPLPNDPTASPSPDHKNTMCSPADPGYNGKDLDALIDAHRHRSE